MDGQVGILVRLQDIDSTIDELRGKLEKIPVAIEEMAKAVEEAEKKLGGGQVDLEGMQKERRQAERDLDAHLEKVNKLNDQTSRVKTNKEYQAILGEIETLKKQESDFEDRILQLMEEATAGEGKIEDLKREVARQKEILSKNEARLLNEKAALMKELEKAEGERAELLPEVSEENMQSYERVKKLRGVAVAEVRNEICMGCRVSIPPQMYADVILNETLQTCSHCQRILFFKKEEQYR